jgi:Zn-dependent protease
MGATSRQKLRATFQLFGFPTQIRPGFGIFLLLLLLIYPAPLGYWIAAAVGLFTLIHELGHALAARRAGCTASISLDFMVAYASYSSQRELNWRSKVFITLAGPAFQIATALITLTALGVNPFSRSDIASSSASAAIWWSGFALGLLNLIPLLPLDGGAIVAAIAERVAPGKGRTAVLYLSFGITLGISGVTLFIDALGLMPLFIFMLMIQYQQIVQPRRLKTLLENADVQASGDPAIDSMILDALVASGEFSRAYELAREAYHMCPAFHHALVAATCALHLEKTSEAISWLNVAERSQIQKDELKHALSENSQFEKLRNEPLVSSEWFTHS